jgi:hypothetical protein
MLDKLLRRIGLIALGSVLYFGISILLTYTLGRIDGWNNYWFYPLISFFAIAQTLGLIYVHYRLTRLEKANVHSLLIPASLVISCLIELGGIINDFLYSPVTLSGTILLSLIARLFFVFLLSIFLILVDALIKYIHLGNNSIKHISNILIYLSLFLVLFSSITLFFVNYVSLGIVLFIAIVALVDVVLLFSIPFIEPQRELSPLEKIKLKYLQK